MDVDDSTWTLLGGVVTAGVAACGWLYARIGGVHARIAKTEDRLDKVVNHMTAEHNRIDDRFGVLPEKYVSKEELRRWFESLQEGQRELIRKFEDFDKSTRHNIKNTDQVVVRMDERLKHLEKVKP